MVITFLFFHGKSSAQDSTEIADLYESDDPTTLKNLKIKKHPHHENIALLELRLKEDSPVLFQLSNKNDDVTLVNKDLSAGSHQIHFDYSNITKADFTFTFKMGNNDNIEINGPFIVDGRLQTIGDTLFNPTPETKIKN